MIPKASRKEATNMSCAVSTGYSVNVYQVTSGRSFILTDLIFSCPGSGLLVFDGLSAASPTASTTKLRLSAGPVVITSIDNGIEFSTGVSCQLDDPNRKLGTYQVWVAGYER